MLLYTQEKGEMFKKIFSGLLSILLVFSMLALAFNIQPVKAGTVIVPDDYLTIQEAINHANEGDIIHVRNGIYYEHVVVDKSVSLIGENRSSTIIDGGGMGTGILVTANHATVQEFSVHNCEVGIKVESNNNVISSNMVASNGHNETEFLTNQEIYQDYVSPLSRWYVHNLINGSYTGFFNITGHTPAISVQALGHEDVNQLGIALFHDKNDDHEPQLQEYVGYGDVKERNVQAFLINPPIGRYIIKILGWEIPEDPGHFDLVMTKYAGYGIVFLSSRNNTVTQNFVAQNPVGLYLYDSYNTTIQLNDAIENVGGISVSNSSECVISNNNASLNKFGSSICRQFGVGLTLWSVHNCCISENNVSSNTFGIWLFNSHDNDIAGNRMSSNGGWGLGLHASHGNTVNRNNMSVTTGLDGIRLQFATQNNITQNYISHNNHAGIFLWLECNNNNIIGNKFYSNIGHGVELKLSHDNTIADNEVFYGINGILIVESTGCTVRCNLVSSNHNGIMVYDSFENTIYHNCIVNNWEQQGLDARGSNLWDNGYPSGGNYWNDHNAPDLYNGPDQNETGGDRIGDVPYIIDGSNIDRYPLIYPYGYVPSPDINNDEIIDILDLVTIALAYGSVPGLPIWKPYADIVQDEIIDIFDLVMMAIHYGETYL
jgi:parallel beta-helix repeat protein